MIEKFVDRISQKGLRHYVDVIVVEGLVIAVAAATAHSRHHYTNLLKALCVFDSV